MAVTNNFSPSTLDLNGKIDLSQPTALVWGPDGRLYVTEVDGEVKVLTVAFGDKTPGDGDATAQFHVTAAVTLGGVKSIPNHDDSGPLNTLANRQVTGIDVTPQFDAEGNPVLIDGKPAVTIYVTSSDSRIGAGDGGEDKGLDTNSGVITKLTQTGTDSWSAVDLVRGFPRSEENHALNGLEVIQEIDTDGRLVSERLIVASGGNANTGAPSNNFAGQQEQPLSAAILEVDLDMLKGMDVKVDPASNRSFVYDLPTLDDPTRPGDPDANDPWGGNDGFNSAKLIDGGPVRMYSPGYRNAYDIEVTEDGRVFTYDNGANNTWGGRPIGEAGDNGGAVDFAQALGYIATNLNNGEGNGNDPINLVNWNPSNKDQFHEVTRSDDLGARALSSGQGGVKTYAEGELTLVYGGHPNPTRAEGSRAGLLFTPKGGADDAFLLVSSQDSLGNGGGSDYDEVVAWFAEVEANNQKFPGDPSVSGNIYGANAGDLTKKVLAVEPGVLYDIYTFSDGSGAVVPAGGAAPQRVVGGVNQTGTFLGKAGLPADIGEIVARPNPIEGNYFEAGKTDGAVDTGNGSINGLTEYTSTVLDGGWVKMSGAIVAASLGGSLIVMGRDANGVVQSTVNSGGFAVAADRTVISAGGAPLGLASIGDDHLDRGLSKAFQGSIWTAVYKQNGPLIEIFQPKGVGIPLAGSELVDPTDHDGDGIDHIADPFEFSAENGYALAPGQSLVLDFSPLNDAFPTSFSSTGLLGASLDGETPNQDAQTAAENFPVEQQRDGLFDNEGNLIPGGNAPIFQIKNVADGSVVGAANTARDAMHTGIRPDADVQRIVSTVTVKNWVAEAGTPQTGQLTGLMFGDGTQANFLRVVFGGVEGVGTGLEVGLELGDQGYTVLAREALPELSGVAVENVELRLEISDLGGDFAVSALYRLTGQEDFTEVALNGGAGFQLPAGVLRDVLTGDHTISSGGTTLPSGAAVGLLAEDVAGGDLTAIDFLQLEIRGFGNEIYADTAAEVGNAGTAGVDTVIYTGAATNLAPLASNVENFDGQGSAADYALTANNLDNTILVGEGANTVATKGGADTVRGTLAQLDGDHITDFSQADQVIVEGVKAADATVTYAEGSAIVTINGASIEFSGPELDGFAAADGPTRFVIEDVTGGLRIALVPDETVVYRVNAGSSKAGAGAGTVAAIDGGPDWVGDATLIGSTGPAKLSGATANVYSAAATDTAGEVTYADGVDAAVVPWQLFVNERSDNINDATKITYDFEVVAGATYRIDLFYTENYTGIFGQTREFDVSVEGAVPSSFDNLNPVEEAAAALGVAVPGAGATDAQKQQILGTTLMRSHTLVAGDDLLTLQFEHGLENPKINAIQIVQIGAQPVDTNPPVVVSITVENPPSVQDDAREVTVVLSDTRGFDAALLEALDGTELQFSGIVPQAVSTPMVALTDGGLTATLTYTITPPDAGWPVGEGTVAIAEGAYTDAAGNGSAAATAEFVFDPNAGGATPTISVGDASAAEGGEAQVTFTRAGDSSEAVEVTFAVTPGTASEADYATPDVTTVTIPAGSTSVTVAVPIVDDEAAEGAETFTVSIVGVSEGAAIGDGAGTVTIAASDAGTGVPEGGAVFALDFETAGNPLAEGGFGSLLGGSGALEAAKASVQGGKLVVQTSDGDLFEASATASKNDFVRAADLSDPAIETAYLSTRFDNPFDAEFLAARGYGSTVPNFLQQGIVIATGDAATNQNPDQAMKLIWGGNGGTAVQLWSQTGFSQVATVTAMSNAAVAAGGTAFGTADVASIEFVMGVDKAAGTVSAFVTLLDATGAVLGGVRPTATPGFASLAPQTIPAAIATAIANGTSVFGVTSNDYDQGAGDTQASFTATWDSLSLTSPQVSDGPGGEEPSGDAFKGADLADLSDDPTAPTDLGTLSLGDSVLQAAQQGPTETGGRDYDYVTFTVAEGQVLQSLILTGYESGDPANQGFLALIEGTDMPAPPTSQAEYAELAAQLLGGTLLGGSGGLGQGADLLGEDGLASGEAQGEATLDFEAPLGAGTYTLWFSQGGAPSTTTLTFKTTEVPLVATLSIADAPAATEAGDSGDTLLLFPLTLSDGFTGEVSVTYAVGGASFTQAVAFADGAGTLSVAVPNDDEDTGGTAVSVTITGAEAGGEALALGQATAGGAVADDDAETGGEPGAVVFALNVGGPAVTGADGTAYEADAAANWVGSKTYTDGASGQPALAGGDYDRDGDTDSDDAPYGTERYGGAPGTAPMVFTRAGLEPGSYLMTLKFAELFNVNFADNKRVFDVTANGVTVVDDLDLFDVAGSADQAYDVTVPVTVGGDGVLTLSFAATADNAKIGAIVLREAAPAGGNAAPTTAPIDAGTVAEDGEPVAIDLLQGAQDADGDALTVQNVAVTDAEGNAVAFTLEGATLTIDPAVLANAVGAGETATLAVAYEVADGQGGVTPGSATLAVEGVEDGTVWYRDADGDGFGATADTLTQVAQPEGYVDQAGDPDDADAAVYPGAPEINDGLDNDGDGATDEDNAAPVVTGETATVASDAALTLTAAELLANDTDADGDTLGVVAVVDAVGGTVALADGVVTFTPEAGFTGAASFAYTVSDGFGGESMGTVAVTVTEPDAGGGTETPIAFTPGAIQSYANEDTTPGFGFAVEDGGASLRLQGNTWKKIALPEGLEITESTVLRFDLTILGSPGEILGIGLETDDNFRTEGDAFFQIAGRQNFSTFASREYFGQAGAQGQTVTYEIDLGALAGRQDLTHLVFVADDDRDAAIDARFGNVAFVEPDGDGGTGGGTSEAPEIFGGTIPDVATTEDLPFEFELPIVDGDTAREDLAFTFTGLPSFVTVEDGMLVGTPGNGDVGTYAVTVTATDPEGNAVTGSFDLTVANVNDAPEVQGALPDRSVVLGANFAMPLPQGVFVDIDEGDALSYAATGLPAGVAIDPVTGAITGTATQAGSFEVTVTASDQAGAAVSTAFTLDVASGPPREAAVIEAEAFTGLGESAFFAAFASSASGKQLIQLNRAQTGTVATELDPAGVVPGAYDLTVRAYDEADGASTLRVLIDRGDGAAPELLGEFTLDRTDLPRQGNSTQAGNLVELTIPGVSVTSGARLLIEGTAKGGENVRLDLVRFIPVDAAPDAAPAFDSSAAFAASEGTLAVGAVEATDPEGQAVSYAIAGGADAARFAIDAATGALSFVSAPDFEAPGDAGGDNVYDVVVAASDGALTTEQAIAVTVGDANDAPEAAANPPAQEGTQGEAVSVPLSGLFSDEDGDALAYTLVGGAPAGLVVENGALVGTPTEAGSFTVTVEASDGQATARTSFALTVEAAASGGGGTTGGLAPTDDLDGDGTANASDADADGDGKANAADSFAYDAQNGRLLGAGQTLDLAFGTDGTPYQNGLTGLLQAGIAGTSALKGFTEETGTARVENGKLIVVASNGDTGTSNNPDDDYQLGVKNRAFTVESRVENPFQSQAAQNFDQLGIHVGVDSTDFAKLVFGFSPATIEFSARVNDAETKAGGANQPLPGGLSLAGFAAVDLKLEVEATSATSATITGSGTFLDAQGNPIAGATDVSFGSITVGGALAAALFDESVGVGAGVTQTQVGGTDKPFNAVYDRFTVTEGVEDGDTGGGDPGDGDGDGGTGGGGAPTNAAEAFAAQGDLDTAKSYGTTVVGAAKLEILAGANDIDISNYGASSFKVTNLGDKKISAIFIDVTSALYPDSVFDPDGKGGDSVAKNWAVNSEGGTGGYVSGTGYFLPGPDPLPNTTGTGGASNGGFKGAMVKFDPNVSGGFGKGEVVGFSGDMDPNSIAGLTKTSVDSGAISGWDVGGISGHELIGSAFTVLFDDGTTATGELMSDKSASGSHALATQAGGASAPGLTVGGVAAGGTGTYGVTAPQIVVTGEPGQTVRITLTKGLDPVTNTANGIDALVAARLDRYDFEVSNNFDSQSVDVTIGANGTFDATRLFDYDDAPANTKADFAGSKTAPIGFVAAVIDPSTGLPASPVTEPVYLTNQGGPVVGDPDGSAPKGYWLESGGALKVQFEDIMGTTPPAGWGYEAPGQGNPGAQGAHYYWGSEAGSIGVNTQPNSGVFKTQFLIEEAGLYSFRVRATRDTNDPSDQRNDMWVRVDGNTAALVPSGTDPLVSSNGYAKVFGASTVWGYSSRFDDTTDENNPLAKLNLDAGLHTIEFAGRSQGYHIDFFELKKGSGTLLSAPNSTFVTEGDTGGGTGGDTGGGTGGDTGGGTGGGTGGATQRVFKVAASADDWEQFGGATSADLELGLNGSDPQTVGIRFADVDIPAGAVIERAFLRFDAYESGSKPASFLIEIQNTEKAASYTNASNPNTRAYAEDDFVWSNVQAWSAGQSYETPDIKALIQGVVGADGVQDGALAFRISGAPGNAGDRAAHAWNSTTGDEPELVIEFAADSLL